MSWVLLGRSWRHLERSWSGLGGLLGAPGRVLDALEAVLEACRALLVGGVFADFLIFIDFSVNLIVCSMFFFRYPGPISSSGSTLEFLEAS